MAVANRYGMHDVVIEEKDVSQALGQEVSPGGSSVLSELWRAADTFAREAERRHRQGEGLSLDLADSFRGLVLAAAIRRHGTGDETFAILSQSHLLRNRNQYRVMNRELERAHSLAIAVGGLCQELDEVLKKSKPQT